MPSAAEDNGPVTQFKRCMLSAGVAASILLNSAGAPALADVEVVLADAPVQAFQVSSQVQAEAAATTSFGVAEAAPALLAPAPAQSAAAGTPMALLAEAPAAAAATAADGLRDLPTSEIPDLVGALLQNEAFLAALVNNEAFLDRLAGDDAVVEELERRNISSLVAVAARRELATELVRRQQLLEELKSRGPGAVIALADTARAAIDAVGSGDQQGNKASLITLETAVELVEDSEELMMAVEGKPLNSAVTFSGDKRYTDMENSVAATEKRLAAKMQQDGTDDAMLRAERQLQAAVKELFIGRGDAAATPAAAAQRSNSIQGAFDQVVMAMAELQRTYSSGTVSKALVAAEGKVAGVEAAAAQAESVELTTAQIAKDVEAIEEAISDAIKPVPAYQRYAVGLSLGGCLTYIVTMIYMAYRTSALPPTQRGINAPASVLMPSEPEKVLVRK